MQATFHPIDHATRERLHAAAELRARQLRRAEMNAWLDAAWCSVARVLKLCVPQRMLEA